jgi:Tol biopolymer transport system component
MRKRSRRARRIAGSVLAAVTAAAVLWTAWNPVPHTAAALQRQVAASLVLSGSDDFEVAPRFSPDGSKVAYAVGDRTSHIVVEDLATRARRTLGDDGAIATSPAFFPDGTRLVYLRSAGGACSLVEIAVDGGTSRTIAPCPAGMRERFDLTPDGRTIVGAATRRADLPSGLFTLDVAGGALAWLTTPEPGAGDDVQPRVSPDGKRVAFFRGAVARRELWTLELATRAERRVGRQSGLAYGLAYMPRGDGVVVAVDWSGVRALERVDFESGTHALIGGRGARFPDVSRAGDIVYEWANYRANLWRVDTREPTLAWPAARYSSQVEVSPDGRRVAFVSNRDGVEAIYVAGVDGGEAVRVTAGDDFRTIRPRWSADAKAIYAVRTPRGDPASVSAAVRIDPDTGVATPLVALGQRVHGVVPAADGTLVVGEQVGHAVRLARAKADGRDAERLPLPLVAEYRAAGAWLVYTQPQLRGLTLCTWPALACRPLDVPFGDATRLDWTLAGDALWLIADAGGRRSLVRYDPSTGRETARVPLDGEALVTSVGAGPGGVPLFVAREERTQVDLMVARR